MNTATLTPDQQLATLRSAQRIHEAEFAACPRSQEWKLGAQFYAAPAQADPEATLAALRQHLEQVAYHHANVSAYQEPQLEFEA